MICGMDGQGLFCKKMIYNHSCCNNHHTSIIIVEGVYCPIPAYMIPKLFRHKTEHHSQPEKKSQFFTRGKFVTLKDLHGITYLLESCVGFILNLCFHIDIKKY